MPFWKSSSEGTDSSSDEGKWVFMETRFSQPYLIALSSMYTKINRNLLHSVRAWLENSWLENFQNFL